ncbi:MAG: TetR/AcrR family transcriptional regulator [Ignavibacteriales bacterium]|nr:TetR/AcrR family transcriptional regulator [Ignavibacteriales bacterium]
MQDTREKIITAALEIFASRGKHGARMEEIASKADVNKALVYYYFNSKDNLFREVLMLIMDHMYRSILEMANKLEANTENPLDRIRRMVLSHFEAFSKNEAYAKVFIQAVAVDPEDVQEALSRLRKDHSWMNSKMLTGFLEEGKKSGFFRDIDTQQVLISVMGMNMIHFIGRPMAKALFELPVEDDEKFVKERGESILDLLLYGILNQGAVAPQKVQP